MYKEGCKNKKDEFNKMVDVNTPIIYIPEHDFVRVDELISDCIGNSKVIEWNPATFVTDFYTKEASGYGCELEEFLRNMLTEEVSLKERFVVLKNIHDLLDETKTRRRQDIITILMLLAQRRLYDTEFNTTIIIVSPIIKVPVELEKYVSYLEFDFPDEEEIEKLIEDHIKVNCYDKNKFSDEDRKELLLSLKGMTPFEIDRVLDMAMSSNGSLSAKDKKMILKQKKQMVKNSGLLELVDTVKDISSIGGLDALKSYLEAKAKIIKNIIKARKFGVSTPKGVFIVGMPGCGKSLCAKAASTLFEVPLLKLDMGSMLGKYVGDSESNLRRAINPTLLIIR
ncbi:MAG: AAA family ATPase [Bacteroidales bacterium]|nr:AAA family ATPase [Bacteroidales bacterium]